MANPYHGLPDHQFWRRSVAATETHRFDPVVAPKFRIEPDAKVATAGSCFAQHISRRLGEIGFNYYVTEPGAALPPEERARRNYGVFSARYGNIYTVAQLWQLFQEAFGRRDPAERWLRRSDGRVVDPWRQQVEPDGFDSVDALRADRRVHLAAVRTMFESCDVFVFTLGLTEAWRSRRDGSVYSVAPGVVVGDYDPAEHDFVNFNISEVQTDLFAFLHALKEVNPGVRVILTVSPVPLVATYEDRSVLVATTYSKAVLRVAAEGGLRNFDWVDYFPSYEIITGSFSGGLYYEADHREVNRLGVAHAMRCFVANFTGGTREEQAEPPAAVPPPVVAADQVCDETVLDAVRF